MKRQLNFWSKPNSAPEEDLVNISLSIEENQFSVIFRKPGTVTPIRKTVITVNDDESFDLRRAFELAGAQVFQDEMDERIYFSNIARSRESAKQAQLLGVAIGWATIIYIICMMVGVFLFKMHIILTLVFSLAIAISSIILIKRKFSKEITT